MVVLVSGRLSARNPARDLGLGRASAGKVHSHVIRARPEKAPHGSWHYHDCKVQFTYVLKGWVKMQYEGQKPAVMKAGSCFFQPPRIKHREFTFRHKVIPFRFLGRGNFAPR